MIRASRWCLESIHGSCQDRSIVTRNRETAGQDTGDEIVAVGTSSLIHGDVCILTHGHVPWPVTVSRVQTSLDGTDGNNVGLRNLSLFRLAISASRFFCSRML